MQNEKIRRQRTGPWETPTFKGQEGEEKSAQRLRRSVRRRRQAECHRNQ